MGELENVLAYGNLSHIQLHFVMDQLQLVIVLEYGNVINVILLLVHVAIKYFVLKDQ
jgi:hypothetical protein